MKKKKYFIIGLAFLFCFSLLGVLYFYTSVTANVSLLKNHYPVFIKKSEDKIHYRLVKEKPLDWVSIDNISKNATMAIVISEDWAFYSHDGLDFNQLKKVFMGFFRHFRFLRGGSTITQQVAKNIFLSHERSIWRKVKEMILAKKMENTLSKRRILEIYLNIVELGPNIYGIKQASYHYFEKHPSELTAREGAFLAMLLPSPIKYHISFEEQKLTEYAKETVDEILEKMKMAKILSEEALHFAKEEKFYWEIVEENSLYYLNEEPKEEIKEEEKEELQEVIESEDDFSQI